MSFNKVRGQELAVNLLKKAIEEKRLAHAYLFIGPEGVGKSLLAKIFAQALNCEKPGAEPCCECVSCKKIEAVNHPDVLWFLPEGKSLQVSIDSIRRLGKAVSFKPYEGRTKVCIIDGADNMTEEASNCLLKTLEEPPKDAVIILLASNMLKLTPTIISRCQKIGFLPLDEELIARELMDRYGADSKQALCVSRFSEGRLGKAVEALEEDALSLRDKVIDEFVVPKQLGYEDVWLYGEPRDKVNEILNTLALYFRDLLVFNLSKDEELLVNLDRTARIEDDSKKYSVEKLEKMIEAIADTQEQIKRNANIKVALSCMRLNIT